MSQDNLDRLSKILERLEKIEKKISQQESDAITEIEKRLDHIEEMLEKRVKKEQDSTQPPYFPSVPVWPDDYPNATPRITPKLDDLERRTDMSELKIPKIGSCTISKSLLEEMDKVYGVENAKEYKRIMIETSLQTDQYRLEREDDEEEVYVAVKGSPVLGD